MIALYCDFDGVINFFGDADARDPDRQFGDVKYGHVTYVTEEGIDFKARLRWSNELVERINKLTQEHDVVFVWLTAWRASAMTALNPLTKLNGSRTVLWEYDEHDSMHQLKLQGLVDDFEDHDYDAFIWVDDFAAEGWETRDIYPKLAPSLVVEPSANFGISRHQMDRIEEFVQKVESSKG